MKIMIDTNVILDCLLDRKPFSDYAEEVLELCMRGKHEGCILASAITDIFYIAGRSMNDLHQLYLLMDDLMEELLLVGVRRKDLMEALSRRASDFEDCLMSVCAEAAGCDIIVTGNIKDFKESPVAAITPEEFCTRQHDQ